MKRFILALILIFSVSCKTVHIEEEFDCAKHKQILFKLHEHISALSNAQGDDFDVAIFRAQKAYLEHVQGLVHADYLKHCGP